MICLETETSRPRPQPWTDDVTKHRDIPVSRYAVLSSILVDIYVNDIRPTCKLSASGRGCQCHVAGIGIGVLGLMCADDLLLISSIPGS